MQHSCSLSMLQTISGGTAVLPTIKLTACSCDTKH